MSVCVCVGGGGCVHALRACVCMYVHVCGAACVCTCVSLCNVLCAIMFDLCKCRWTVGHMYFDM